jgi:3-deoxy-manno-octulosonate cytidylyltransferase (CMP-KDO synthetase)
MDGEVILMKTVIMIPARLHSTRLPKKLLLDLGGAPVLAHTVRQALKVKADRHLLLTDSEEIREAAGAWGIEVCMTRPDHENGAERLAEAVDLIHLEDEDLVINVQGDEPFIAPENIERVAMNLQARPDVALATLAEPIHDLETFIDPSRVKVVCNQRGEAMYFSRAPIPWDRALMPNQLPEGVMAHIGIYAYRVDFLRRYRSMGRAPIEMQESLEQLRVLWYGERIHVDIAPARALPGIYTLEGLEKARRYWASALADSSR